MPEELCPSYSDGCEWNLRYLWHWTNWYARLDVLALAILLAYILVVATLVLLRYHRARRAGGFKKSGQSAGELALDLSMEVGNLRSIAFIAPYLGLIGTCLSLLNLFEGFDMEKHAAEVMLVSKAAAALLTTAAGIIVAVPATCFYNYLRTRIDLLDCGVANGALSQTSRRHQAFMRLQLARRFSAPVFALPAALSLALLVAACTPFLRTEYSTGLSLELASTRCEYDGDDRLVVLHIANDGKLFLNQEQEEWNSLAGRLSEIYSMRKNRTLYVLTDEGVTFQTVADAVDIAESTTSTKPQPLDITVRLVTPTAMKAPCVLPPVPARVNLQGPV
jgi:biopolymer transport protein ExbD